METLRDSDTSQAFIVPRSPFGGIPRNWKLLVWPSMIRCARACSPFGGIPRNWKLVGDRGGDTTIGVPPSGGSLEIGNSLDPFSGCAVEFGSPFGGIPRNWKRLCTPSCRGFAYSRKRSPFGGIPRNWKPEEARRAAEQAKQFPLRGDP